MHKNISLAAKDENKDDGTYQVWFFGSDDEDMCHPANGVMYATHHVEHQEIISCLGSL